MLDTLIKDTMCEVCNGKLSFEYYETFEAFKDSSDITTTNIIECVDSIVDKYLIFMCNNCNAKYRYTYKDIDKVVRNNIFRNLLLLLTQGEIVRHSKSSDGVMVYCGKCTGYDGQGSCLRSVFYKCDIKKFPAR
jgi:RNase P subunit RPR2